MNREKNIKKSLRNIRVQPMSNKKLDMIRMDRIDLSDRTYIFTFEPILSRMISSIQSIGILNPPILARKSDTPDYRIISGFKRVLSAIHLKHTEISAHVYDDLKGPNAEFFHIALHENLGTRILNPIEKSNIIKKLSDLFHIDQQEIISHYLPVLNLTPNLKVFHIYLALYDLEDNIKIAILEELISPETAFHLLNFTPDDRREMYELFMILKAGKNQQRELVRLLHDISVREKTSIEDIIHQKDLQTMILEPKFSPAFKLDRIKAFLKKKRYPIYSDAEEKFNRLSKDLHLPPEIIFSASPFFESDKYSIKIVFRNQQEFDERMEILNEIAKHEKLIDLDRVIS